MIHKSVPEKRLGFIEFQDAKITKSEDLHKRDLHKRDAADVIFFFKGR